MKDNAVRFPVNAHASNAILFPGQEEKESKEKKIKLTYFGFTYISPA